VVGGGVRDQGRLCCRAREKKDKSMGRVERKEKGQLPYPVRFVGLVTWPTKLKISLSSTSPGQ
jgi:hypothetical protein